MSQTQSVPRHGQLGITACQLVEMLKEGKPGCVLNDDDILESHSIDIKPGGRHYPTFQTARKYVLAHYGVLWKRVYGENRIQCCDESEKLNESRSNLKSIKSKAKRAVDVTRAIDTTKLDYHESREVSAMSAQLGCIAMFASNEATKRLQESDHLFVPSIQTFTKLFNSETND